MRFSINSDTIEVLKKTLEEKNKEAVRVVIKGFGWGGPSFGIVLDEQKNEDEAITIDGVKVVADKEFSFLFEDAKIVHTKGLFGNSFAVVTGSGGGSC